MPMPSAAVPLPMRAVHADPLAGTGAFLWMWRGTVYLGLLLAFALGGTAVRVAAVAAALLVPLADRSGAGRHLVHTAGLAIGLLMVPLFGVPFGHALAPHLGLPLGMLIGCLTVFVAATLAAGLTGRRLFGPLRRHRYLYVVDRSAGSLLGVAEGVFVAAALTWVLHLLGPTIYLYSERWAVTHPTAAGMLRAVDALTRGMTIEDPFGRWAAGVNPLLHVPRIRTAAAVAEVTADRETFWQAFDDGVFDDLLQEPVVQEHYQAFRGDATLRRAAKYRDLTTLLSSPQFAAALADDEFCRAVARHWPELRARATEAKIARLRELTAKLDAPARAKVNQAEQRAGEFGIRLP